MYPGLTHLLPTMAAWCPLYRWEREAEVPGPYLFPLPAWEGHHGNDPLSGCSSLGSKWGPLVKGMNVTQDSALECMASSLVCGLVMHPKVLVLEGWRQQSGAWGLPPQGWQLWQVGVGGRGSCSPNPDAPPYVL